MDRDQKYICGGLLGLLTVAIWQLSPILGLALLLGFAYPLLALIFQAASDLGAAIRAIIRGTKAAIALAVAVAGAAITAAYWLSWRIESLYEWFVA